MALDLETYQQKVEKAIEVTKAHENTDLYPIDARIEGGMEEVGHDFITNLTMAEQLEVAQNYADVNYRMSGRWNNILQDADPSLKQLIRAAALGAFGREIWADQKSRGVIEQ